MAKIDIHLMKETEAQEISEMIGRSILEMNAGDYDMEVLMDQVKFYTPDRVKELATLGHTYVATEDKRVVACCTIVELPNSNPPTAEVRSLFVEPEDCFRGIGRAMLTNLENDEYYKAAKRIRTEASASAMEFCQILGFRHIGGTPIFEDRDHYAMEKFKD